MSNLGTRVVKIGGSLLDFADLTERLELWLQTQPPSENLVVVGGGEIVEAMRQLARLYPLQDSFVHWECVRLLQTSYAILRQLISRANCLTSREDWLKYLNARALRLTGAPVENQAYRNHCLQSITLVNVSAFYAQELAHELPLQLPESWDTTTDSISALLCRLVGAQELVLLKSTDPPAGTLVQLADGGFVDGAFPQAAHQLPKIQLVNLRAEPFTAMQLTTT